MDRKEIEQRPMEILRQHRLLTVTQHAMSKFYLTEGA